jgi:putative aldouronate transport system permease protein
MTILVAFMVAPFINVIAVSLSSEDAVMSGFVYLWPKEFTTYTYKAVFKGSMLIQSLKNTILVTVVGTGINMFMTIAAAYPLSKKRLRGRNGILLFITLTMLINAGMIPNFILVKQLKLINSYWSIWLTGAISTYNLIVLKTFFQSIPDSLEESAAMDGCNDLGILFRIVLPLSGPALATIALFYAVGHWNSYFNIMLYITSSVKATLQVRLRDLINMSSMDTIKNAIMDSQEQQTIAEESIKAASIVIATVPILIVYPFLQRYFVKGVMIGSIKG